MTVTLHIRESVVDVGVHREDPKCRCRPTSSRHKNACRHTRVFREITSYACVGGYTGRCAFLRRNSHTVTKRRARVLFRVPGPHSDCNKLRTSNVHACHISAVGLCYRVLGYADPGHSETNRRKQNKQTNNVVHMISDRIESKRKQTIGHQIKQLYKKKKNPLLNLLDYKTGFD